MGIVSSSVGVASSAVAVASGRVAVTSGSEAGRMRRGGDRVLRRASAMHGLGDDAIVERGRVKDAEGRVFPNEDDGGVRDGGLRYGARSRQAV